MLIWKRVPILLKPILLMPHALLWLTMKCKIWRMKLMWKAPNLPNKPVMNFQQMTNHALLPALSGRLHALARFHLM
ncbi:hypothetical protein BMETH_1031_1 [methanotrophic bacterial endosymbiont of Bathymodiolus sp.]|nr:hypothetical protein BMETH_1031_1 [methanotrophic bacterial endosymbiont of Bathymodiolus sp.]